MKAGSKKEEVRSREEVVNSPASRTCARVVCRPYGHTHTGIDNTCFSDHAQSRAHARKVFHDEMVAYQTVITVGRGKVVYGPTMAE